MSESPDRRGSVRVDRIRHSIAGYGPEKALLKGDTPLGAVERELQQVPDLTPEGIAFAEKSAREYFGSLDPKDKIFIVASNMARTLDTAAIYAKIAREMGFEVVKPTHVRGKLAEEVGGGDVRVLRELAVRKGQTLLGLHSMTPDKALPEINWANVDPEFKRQWDEAHAYMKEAGDHGSWGSNFFAHSEEVAKRWPLLDIKTVRDLHERQLNNLNRLTEWSVRKAREKDPDGRYKILAFGHENDLGIAMHEYFGNHAVKNCELVSFEPDGRGTFTITKSGKKSEWNEKITPMGRKIRTPLGGSMTVEERAAEIERRKNSASA